MKQDLVHGRQQRLTRAAVLLTAGLDDLPSLAESAALRVVARVKNHRRRLVEVRELLDNDIELIRRYGERGFAMPGLRCRSAGDDPTFPAVPVHIFGIVALSLYRVR